MESKIDPHDNKTVRFGSVETREYPMTLGANPATKIGAPVCLGWEYRQLPKKSAEQEKQRNQSPRSFYLNYYQRKKILETAGFDSTELNRAEKYIKWERTKRKLSEYQSFPVLWVKSWKVEYGRRKAKSFVKKYRKENGLKGIKKKRQTPPT